MNLKKKISIPGPTINKKFLLSNKYYLNRNPNSIIIEPVDSLDSIVFRGDFYGFLNSIEIPPRLHYINLLINGLKNPQDFEGGVDSIHLIKKDIVPNRITQ